MPHSSPVRGRGEAPSRLRTPYPRSNPVAIARLVNAGHMDRILLSHDVFLKMMLSHYGGNGYAYVLRHFLPRLKRHGLEDGALDRMMRDNPRSVFQTGA